MIWAGCGRQQFSPFSGCWLVSDPPSPLHLIAAFSKHTLNKQDCLFKTCLFTLLWTLVLTICNYLISLLVVYKLLWFYFSRPIGQNIVETYINKPDWILEALLPKTPGLLCAKKFWEVDKLARSKKTQPQSHFIAYHHTIFWLYTGLFTKACQHTFLCHLPKG